MKDELGWSPSWNSLWEQRNYYKTAKAIRVCYDDLPKDLMSFIAYDNRFHFVTINRNNRTGGQDRKYIDSQIEGKLLLDEIRLLAPNIIVFQGKAGIWNCHLEELREKYKVIVAYHPSCWQRGADKLQYIVESIGPQIGK